MFNSLKTDSLKVMFNGIEFTGREVNEVIRDLKWKIHHDRLQMLKGSSCFSNDELKKQIEVSQQQVAKLAVLLTGGQ